MSEQGPALRFAPTTWGVKSCWPSTSSLVSHGPLGKSSLSISAMSSGRRKWGAVSCLGHAGASRTLRCFQQRLQIHPGQTPKPHQDRVAHSVGRVLRQEVLGGLREAEPNPWSPWLGAGGESTMFTRALLSLPLLD